jgi:hypothetical protein
MSLEDRRKLGVNFFSVFKAAKELSKDPEFEPESRKDFAEKILEKISEKKLPQLEEEGIDLEALIAFILKVLPIILLFLA